MTCRRTRDTRLDRRSDESNARREGSSDRGRLCARETPRSSPPGRRVRRSEGRFLRSEGPFSRDSTPFFGGNRRCVQNGSRARPKNRPNSGARRPSGRRDRRSERRKGSGGARRGRAAGARARRHAVPAAVSRGGRESGGARESDSPHPSSEPDSALSAAERPLASQDSIRRFHSRAEVRFRFDAPGSFTPRFVVARRRQVRTGMAKRILAQRGAPRAPRDPERLCRRLIFAICDSGASTEGLSEAHPAEVLLRALVVYGFE
jgi:hypothetical protein